MKIVVLKFGGTSVGNIDRIKNVARIIASYKRKRHGVIVVSSAMSGSTNELIKKTKELSNNFDSAEYDVLLSTGEQAACALIAGRLKHLGFKARSWISWQLPIITEGLSLLNIKTKMLPQKKIRKVNAKHIETDIPFQGYEIHIGETYGSDCERPFASISGKKEGATSKDGRVIGTYLHGMFVNNDFRKWFLENIGFKVTNKNYTSTLEKTLDELADS